MKNYQVFTLNIEWGSLYIENYIKETCLKQWKTKIFSLLNSDFIEIEPKLSHIIALFAKYDYLETDYSNLLKSKFREFIEHTNRFE